MTADDKYTLAMRESAELLDDMRAAQQTADPVRSLMAAIWRHGRNGPFLATVHEAVEEMRAPIEQAPLVAARASR